MDPVEFTISDGEETYVLVAHPYRGGWVPALYDVRTGIRAISMPVFLTRLIAEQAPYPTPGRCLLALAEAVIAELLGVRT